MKIIFNKEHFRKNETDLHLPPGSMHFLPLYIVKNNNSSYAACRIILAVFTIIHTYGKDDVENDENIFADESTSVDSHDEKRFVSLRTSEVWKGERDNNAALFQQHEPVQVEIKTTRYLMSLQFKLSALE